MKKRLATLLFTLPCALLSAGCSPLGPDYQRPALEMPQEWKSSVNDSQWQLAQPADDVPKHDWWTIFGDEQLNHLENRSLQDNPTLQAALTRLDQALAQSSMHAAGQFPTVQLGASGSRTRTSANRPVSSYGAVNSSTIQNDFRPQLSVSYEFDWLGKIRRDIEGARASAQQARADQENVRLVLTAQVASAYFQLHQYDEEIDLLSQSTASQQKVLDLINKRYTQGAAGQADLAQQSALLESSQAQLELLKAQRNRQENALATLSGTPAASFHLPPGKLPKSLPDTPLVLPSSLLERRPDIASAERAIVAANAQIGVAKAAYFPSLTLSPTYGGYESNRLANLFSAPSLIWSIGIAATQTLFDGGRTSAGVDFAKAGYVGTVASYRQAVLTAIQESQDAMDTLHELALARQKQDEAVRQQNKAYRISLARYREGLDNALTLAVTQQNQLAAERILSQIQGNQFLSSVGLIKALGGGWQGL
jgi:outer membrane protein, multidrug efflux system